ncbi:MAG: twin-arginine translocation signal domain-containing protein, partial [Acidobacteriota bacterium]|nr:twin-arginine translocation signal domain-containing protein [Acidobacteriota bacterium]
MNRRTFLKASAAAPLLAAGAAAAPDSPTPAQEWVKPVFNLHSKVPAPVKIASIELLRAGKQFFLRTRSTDGAEGVILTKDMEDFVPILQHRVIPHYLNQDARDLETLIDRVYLANYKLSGQAFWCPAAYVEQSLFDLLGKSVHKSASELMGGPLRKEIPVYLSGSGRDTTAEEEVEVYVRGVEETGAKAVKFKIGGRMSGNQDSYPGRTEKIFALAAKSLAGKVTLMADANGSYSAAKAIEVGKRLEEMHYLWFEEPCPWEEKSEMQQAKAALKIKIAFGEQDSSLW